MRNWPTHGSGSIMNLLGNLYELCLEIDIMYVAHRIELRTTKNQHFALLKACGVKRFVYNTCLEKCQRDYKTGVKYSRKLMQKHVQELRVTYPWMTEVSARCGYYAVDCLDDAMTRFWNKKSAFPKFKRKGECDSFRLEHASFYKVYCRNLTLPKIGMVKMREKIRFQGRLMGVTIRAQSGKWFATFLIEMAETPKREPLTREPIVGCDFGLKTAVMLSTGQEFPANKPLKRSLRKLQRLQRCLSRKQKGSNRRQRARLRVARLHYKVHCQRSAWLHHISNQLTRRFDHIVIEDLNVRGMMQNRRLSRSLNDASFSELRRQIEYKSLWRGCTVTVAERFFASSQTCPTCGVKNAMPLSQRIYRCACGYSADRDLTAAVNLEAYGRHRYSGDLKRAPEFAKASVDDAKDLPLTKEGRTA